MPRVSVLSPTYNHAKYIREAVYSVLEQTFTDFEYIITDDGSTDNTLKELNKIAGSKVKILKHDTNLGTSQASATAYAASIGEIIAWINTDDRWLPDHLEKSVCYLDNHPEVNAIFAIARYIDETGNITGESSSKTSIGKDRYQHLKHLFFGINNLCAPTIVVRRSALDRTGLFPVNFRQLNDMHLWIRLLFDGEITVLDHIGVEYRWRDNKNNTCAWSKSTRNQFIFESYKVRQLYLDHIQNSKLLERIFPEVLNSRYPVCDELIPFHLAQIGIQSGDLAAQLFGLDVIHSILNEANGCRILKDVCSFTQADFFELCGNKNVFSTECDWLLENDPEVIASRYRYRELMLALLDRNKLIKSAKALLNQPFSYLRHVADTIQSNSPVQERKGEKDPFQ